MTQNNVGVSLDAIPDNFVCNSDIFDVRGVLLLGRGKPLNASAREQIHSRGVSVLELPADVAASLKNSSRKLASKKSPAGPVNREPRNREPYSSERSDRFNEQASEAVGQLANLGKHLQTQGIAAVEKLSEYPSDFLDMLTEDADQTLQSTRLVPEQATLAARCVSMSVLSINTAIEMELEEEHVVNVGLAGLFHDLGLFLMPNHYADPRNVLDEDELWEYRQHPDLTKRTLEDLMKVNDLVRLLTGQVHEQPDGSGYPKGIRANLIHPLSKILSVVDAYLTLVSPGPGRPAIIPHDAISFLLYEGSQGRFDPNVMRAFIRQLTLFPIGSWVKLDDGKVATVIRRDEGHYATPVIHCHTDPPDQFVPLSDSPRTIAHPVIEDSSSQMRFSQDLMTSMRLASFER